MIDEKDFQFRLALLVDKMKPNVNYRMTDTSYYTKGSVKKWLDQLRNGKILHYNQVKLIQLNEVWRQANGR